MPEVASWVFGSGASVAPVNLRRWRGAFCIPDALPDLPRLTSTTRPGLIWTPAYGCYDGFWRARIREAFRTRRYTHFVYNCAGLPYGNDYPELADDAERVARDLSELESAGLVPVVCATDDRRGGNLSAAFVANGYSILVCFPGWEFNGWLDTEGMKRCIADTRHAAPHADCYIHFTPGHGSISADEIAGWSWCQAIGAVGLLSQDDHWDDPVETGRGLEGTAQRLAGQISGWDGMHLLNVAFEQQTSVLYRGRTEADGIAFTTKMLQHCPSIAGWCDGGRV